MHIIRIWRIIMFIKKLSRFICLALLIGFANQQQASAITQQQATVAISIIAGCAVAGYTFVSRTVHAIDNHIHHYGKAPITDPQLKAQIAHETKIRAWKNLALSLVLGIGTGLLAYSTATKFLIPLFQSNPPKTPRFTSYEIEIGDNNCENRSIINPSKKIGQIE